MPFKKPDSKVEDNPERVSSINSTIPMEPKLISGFSWFLRLYAILAAVFIFGVPFFVVSKKGLDNFTLGWLLTFYPFAAYFTWFAYSFKHPIYYDDDYLYFKVKGCEKKVAYTSIRIFMWGESGMGWFNRFTYYDENNKVRRVRFSFKLAWFFKDAEEREFVAKMKLKNPKIEITNGSGMSISDWVP